MRPWQSPLTVFSNDLAGFRKNERDKKPCNIEKLKGTREQGYIFLQY